MKPKITLFDPHVPKTAVEAVDQTLHNRWIGQGPKVDEFEKLWEKKISSPHQAVAVGSCTHALHLAYIMANIRPGDEVISPIFTFPATNIPLLYQKAKIVFADVGENLLIDPKDIVCVHYGGSVCDLDEIQAIADKYKIPIIEDAAQAQLTSILPENNMINVITYRVL